MNDAFVESVAMEFMVRFPELHEHAKTSGKPGALEFDVELPDAGPSDRLHGGLCFSASKLGVSVGMDGVHTFHMIGVDSYQLEKMRWTPEAQMHKAFDQFEGLLADRIVVAESWAIKDFDDFKRGDNNPSVPELADVDKVRSMRKKWPDLPWRIRSWNGTRDEDILPEPSASPEPPPAADVQASTGTMNPRSHSEPAADTGGR